MANAAGRLQAAEAKLKAWQDAIAAQRAAAEEEGLALEEVRIGKHTHNHTCIYCIDMLLGIYVSVQAVYGDRMRLGRNVLLQRKKG